MFPRLFVLCLLFAGISSTLHAQSEETRNKIQMTLSSNGKSVVADLSSVATSLSRYADYYASLSKDSAGKTVNPADKKGSILLTMTVRKIKPELLVILAKKSNQFSGSIVVTDTYGKNPTMTIKFTKASLDAYSDQYSASTYADDYYGGTLSISCGTININGVEIEL